MSVRHWKQFLSYAAQIVAALGFIFSSVWLRHDFHHAPVFVRNAISSMDNPSSGDAVISSRVLRIPYPEEFSSLAFKVQTKQFRFELEALKPSASPDGVRVRRPARKDVRTSAIPAGWSIARIVRVVDGDREEIELVRDEENGASGSVFVELDEGENEFELEYRGGTGEARGRAVKIVLIDKNS